MDETATMPDSWSEPNGRERKQVNDMETQKKQPLGWLASGSSDAGRTVADWVKEPETKKEVMGRVCGVLMGGAVAVAMVTDMGFQGVLIDAGAVVGTAAWFHFSPKAKERRSSREKTSGGEAGRPEEGTPDVVMGSAVTPPDEEAPSTAWTEAHPEVGQPVTWDDGDGSLDDEPTIRLESPHLSRQGVQSPDDLPAEGSEWGVHAGQGAAFVPDAECPDLGQGTNQGNHGEWVSGPRTATVQEVDKPRSEAVQGLDAAPDDWFVRYIQEKEEIPKPVVEEFPVLPDPFDASRISSEQAPLWPDGEPVEDESEPVAEQSAPAVSEEPANYQELRNQQARDLERRQDVMLDDYMLNGLSVRRIAEKYSMSPSTVGDWIGKAKKRRMEGVEGFRWGQETDGNTMSGEF